MTAPSLLDEMVARLEAAAPEEVPLTEAGLQRLGDLYLISCDFVGDSGCCDPDCYHCYAPLRPENLRTLAQNLATAAALCRSWSMHDVEPAWRPGCHLKP